MLKPITLMLALVLALPAAATPTDRTERLRQYYAETTTDAGQIIAKLKQRLPAEVALAETEDGAMIHYAGNKTPPALGNFLTAGFTELDPNVIALGKTVSLTLMVSDLGNMTEMSLMVMARFPASTVPVLKGGHIIMDGTGAAPCQGHMVIQHTAPIEDAAPAYVTHLETEGFAFQEYDPQETSFFIGHRPGCDLALYLQENQGASLIVIRYLED